jgi:hypothetical protein
MTAVAEQVLAPPILQQVAGELRTVLTDSERELGNVARDFEELARASGVILKTAGTIVGCVESDRMATVLPRVQQLGSAAKRFIHARLEATSGILETVTSATRAIQARRKSMSSQASRIWCAAL